MKYLPHEPVEALKNIKVAESGEPLVDIAKTCPEIALKPGLKPYSKLVRKRVGEMLCQAAKKLPQGYQLQLRDGYRPREDQQKAFEKALKKYGSYEEAQKWVMPADGKIPPYHSTGGTVDVELLLPSGKLAPMKNKKNWKTLFKALSSAGLTNYPLEWWHWSYGDPGWAYRIGQETAIYGEIKLADAQKHLV